MNIVDAYIKKLYTYFIVCNYSHLFCIRRQELYNIFKLSIVDELKDYIRCDIESFNE